MMMRRTRLTLAATLGLSACVGSTPPPVIVPIAPVRPLYGPVGLERVMGRDAGSLVALFGKPDADISEGSARKLQFTGPICVLDAYLYPHGSGASVVTHVDARQTDGRPIDRASCVAALTRRSGGK